MAEQTAVEWLREAIEYNLYMHPSNTDWLPSLVEQSKDMEKEQLMNAHTNGKIQGVRSTNNAHYSSLITAEEYYNQTFKK